METCELEPKTLTSIEKTDEYSRGIIHELIDNDAHRRNIIDKLMDNDKVNYGNTPITLTVAIRTCESIEIIKSTIEKLHEQIDFLKEELREKNLLIKILNFRNAY